MTELIEHETPETSIKETRERDANPLSLIQQALSAGLDSETISKFMDLQDREALRQAKSDYAIAMNNCEAEMPTVVRNRENKHTRSWYASLDAVLAVIKPVYTRHGFSVSVNEDPQTIPDTVTLTATVRHRGGYSEKFTTTIPVDGAGIKGNTNKTATQAKGSTLHYGRRYILLMIFNISVADEDTDGNLPPPNQNPEQDPNAVKLPTRQQRQEAKNSIDLKPFVMDVLDALKAKFDSGDAAVDKLKISAWVEKCAGRKFEYFKLSQWTEADINKCLEALSMPKIGEIP